MIRDKLKLLRVLIENKGLIICMNITCLQNNLTALPEGDLGIVETEPFICQASIF